MQQLRLVRTTEEALVVSPIDHSVEDGPTPQYSLPVDERLRTAVARVPGRRVEGARPRTRAAMTPRELQARIRGGQSVDEVVEASGLPPEKVDRYAGPVLAERYHVSQTVRRLSTPHTTDSERRPLGEVVDERLAAEADGGSVQWDAWQEQDGTWTVQVSWEREGRPLAARWAWHASRRALRARDGIADDVARPLHEGDPMAFVRPLRPVQPRGGDLPDVEQVPVRPDATTPPAAASPGSAASSTPPTTPASSPGASSSPAASSAGTSTSGGSSADRAPQSARGSSARPVPAPSAPATPVAPTAPAASRPEPAAQPEPAARPEPLTAEAPELPAEERRAVGDGRPQPRPRPGTSRRPSGRAAVPSWDDILFGARQQQ